MSVRLFCSERRLPFDFDVEGHMQKAVNYIQEKYKYHEVNDDEDEEPSVTVWDQAPGKTRVRRSVQQIETRQKLHEHKSKESQLAHSQHLMAKQVLGDPLRRDLENDAEVEDDRAANVSTRFRDDQSLSSVIGSECSAARRAQAALAASPSSSGVTPTLTEPSVRLQRKRLLWSAKTTTQQQLQQSPLLKILTAIAGNLRLPKSSDDQLTRPASTSARSCLRKPNPNSMLDVTGVLRSASATLTPCVCHSHLAAELWELFWPTRRQ